MIDPISEILLELYSLAWQDGREGLNRRSELGKRFTKSIETLIREHIANAKEFAVNQYKRFLEDQNDSH